MVVIFHNVGRARQSWVAASPPGWSLDWLFAEVQRRGGLRADDIEFRHDGAILADNRKVGEFAADEAFI